MISLKAPLVTHVILIRVSRDEDGKPVLTHRGQLYDVIYGEDVLLRRVRTPFHEAARELQHRGAGEKDLLSMRWEHEPMTVSMAGRVGIAAGLRVVDGSSPPKPGIWTTPFVETSMEVNGLEADAKAIGAAKGP